MRRHTLWRWMLLLSVIAVAGMFATSVMAEPMLHRPILKVDTAGLPAISEYPIPPSMRANGTFRPYTAVFLVRDGDRFIALGNRSTHLREPVIWSPQEQLLVDPISGARYTPLGQNIAGPAPRPLDRFPVRVHPDGYLEILLDQPQIVTAVR